MKLLNKALTAALLSACAVTQSVAHDEVPGKKQAQPIVLQNGTLHTVTKGVLSQTDLLFADGKIVAIGQDLAVPADAQAIDISGQHVYPGVIAMDTTLGLNEIEAVRATRDADEVGDVTPEVAGHIAFNADSEVIPTVRYNGVAYAQVVPEGGMVCRYTCIRASRPVTSSKSTTALIGRTITKRIRTTSSAAQATGGTRKSSPNAFA